MAAAAEADDTREPTAGVCDRGMAGVCDRVGEMGVATAGVVGLDDMDAERVWEERSGEALALALPLAVE